MDQIELRRLGNGIYQVRLDGTIHGHIMEHEGRWCWETDNNLRFFGTVEDCLEHVFSAVKRVI